MSKHCEICKDIGVIPIWGFNCLGSPRVNSSMPCSCLQLPTVLSHGGTNLNKGERWLVISIDQLKREILGMGDAAERLLLIASDALFRNIFGIWIEERGEH